MNKRQQNGILIAKARKASESTQQEMSIKTGINKSTISQIENGRFGGSLDIIETYIDALNLQITVEPKSKQLPNWDNIEDIFGDD